MDTAELITQELITSTFTTLAEISKLTNRSRVTYSNIKALGKKGFKVFRLGKVRVFLKSDFPTLFTAPSKTLSGVITQEWLASTFMSVGDVLDELLLGRSALSSRLADGSVPAALELFGKELPIRIWLRSEVLKSKVVYSNSVGKVIVHGVPKVVRHINKRRVSFS